VRSTAALLIVGCGRLGGALLKGLEGRENVFVLDPKITAVAGATLVRNASQVAGLPRPLQIVLAVKPGAIVAAAQELNPYLEGEVSIVSVAAGLSLATLRGLFGERPRLFRAMPNTAIAMRAGVTALASESVPDRDVTELFASVGEAFWIEDETQFDAVTAVSGSGPAYFFLLGESLAKAGVQLGLPEEIAVRLARATLGGAGASVMGRAESLEALWREVSSPGGVTEAALSRFGHEDRLDRLVVEAIAAGATRAGAIREAANAVAETQGYPVRRSDPGPFWEQ
jgi:pyrroline-5-carboxylate reductase